MTYSEILETQIDAMKRRIETQDQTIKTLNALLVSLKIHNAKLIERVGQYSQENASGRAS